LPCKFWPLEHPRTLVSVSTPPWTSTLPGASVWCHLPRASRLGLGSGAGLILSSQGLRSWVPW
jgi:hypothetical protein